MNEQEALRQMVAPGTPRPGKYRNGVIQILVTSSCDMGCVGCTQGSNLRRRPWQMSVSHFEQALESLSGYWGVVGMFGGNPALHKEFEGLCELMKKYIPYEQRGIWCNHPLGKGRVMRETFNPAVSNLNVHLNPEAFRQFKVDWPECSPVGLTQDSRHSPPYVAMRDVLKKDCGCAMDDTCSRCNNTRQVYDQELAWDLISNCDINQHWSAMVGVFHGELRAWFCEVAGAQSILHQDEPDYPDTGIKIEEGGRWRYTDPPSGYEFCQIDRSWWELEMSHFAHQVRKHCHDCGVPLRGYGELSQSPAGVEQTSETHSSVYTPKRSGRVVQKVTEMVELGVGKLQRMTDYLGNSKR